MGWEADDSAATWPLVRLASGVKGQETENKTPTPVRTNSANEACSRLKSHTSRMEGAESPQNQSRGDGWIVRRVRFAFEVQLALRQTV